MRLPILALLAGLAMAQGPDTHVANGACIITTRVGTLPGVVSVEVDPQCVVMRNAPPTKAGDKCTDTDGVAFAAGKLWACLRNVWYSFTPDQAPVEPPPPPPPPVTGYLLRIYVVPAGAGTVTTSPALTSQVELGYAGSYQGYGAGAVTLTATPAAGYRFVGWSVGSSNPLTLFVARALTIQATFQRIP